MKFVIPYLSKEPNPNAGNTMYFVPGMVTYEVEIPILIADYENRIQYQDDCLYTYLLLESEFKEFIKLLQLAPPPHIHIIKRQPQQVLHSLVPEGKWIYKYDPDFEVQCDACNAKFPHTELYSNEIDEYYSELICPKCHEWDCCEIEFQR